MTDLDARKRWLALYVLCLGDLMIVLDSTIVNVALPSIRSDLGFSEASLAWVVNAYLLTFGGFLLLAGRRLAALRAREFGRSAGRGPCDPRGRRRGCLRNCAFADHDPVHRAG